MFRFGGKLVSSIIVDADYKIIHKPQTNWTIYNKAAGQEKMMFFQILKDAVDDLMIEYKYCGNGRPPVYLADIIKSLCIKAYHNYSFCRLESELKIAKAMGIIDVVHKRSTLTKYMQNINVTEILHKLYKVIAEPLSIIEINFAIDATGVSSKYGEKRWVKVRHTKKELSLCKQYAKLHIISGCKTNIITSAKITKGTNHESPFLKPLLEDTIKNFTPQNVLADSGYLSKNNVKIIKNIGALPFIKGKKNINVIKKGRNTAWNNMLKMWKYNQPEFAKHYHQRSNVESTFSALKRRFGDFCRCKKQESQENEILCRIVCFNASVLSKSLLLYNIKPEFIASL